MSLPLLLLPFRLETAFVQDARAPILQIRAWPDQIHITAERNGISQAEAEALDAIAATRGEARAARIADFETLVGPVRAQELIRRDALGDRPPVASGEWSEPPLARCLPEQLIFQVEMVDGQVFSQDGARLPEALPMGPGAEDFAAFSGKPDDPLFWMEDFKAALRLGLAAQVRLEGERNFDRVAGVSVLGIPRQDRGSDDLTRLLRGHAGGAGVQLLPPGTATKGIETPPEHSGEAGRLARAFGVSPDLLPGPDGDAAAPLAAEIIWSALFRPALLEGWGVVPGEPQEPGPWIEEIGRLYRQSLRPRGPFAALNVGAQPYGVLPIARSEKADDPIRLALQSWRARFAQAGHGMRARDQATGGWHAMATALTHAPQSVAWRRRRVHSAMAWVSYALMSTARLGAGTREAHEIRREKLQGIGLGDLDPRLAALSTVVDGEAKLLPEALLARRPDGAGDFRWLEQALSGSLEALYTGFRQSDAGSGLELFAVSGLRWLTLELAIAQSHPPEEVPQQAGFGAQLSLAPSGWRSRLEEAFGADPTDLLLAEVVERSPERQAREPFERLSAFIKSLKGLAKLPADQAEAALAGALDAASFRIDAWQTALATEALDHARRREPDGLMLGGYGWMEGSGLRETAPASFHLAPSLDHAVTAGMIGEGWQGDGVPPLDLSAESVRQATALADRLRRGGDHAEAFGALARDWLTARALADVADDLARAYPLRGESTGLAASANGLADGAKLLESARAGSLGGLRVETVAGTAPLAALLGTSLEDLAAALTKAADAYYDLCMVEGLHGWVTARPDAAKAAFEALSGGGPPPERFESVSQPISQSRLAFGVALAVPQVFRPDPDAAPLALAAPELAQLAEALTGSAIGSLTCVLEDDEGGDTVHRVTLSDLGLSPLEAVALLPPGSEPLAGLRPPVALALARAGRSGRLAQITPDLEAEDWLWSVSRAAALIGAARPLRLGDLPGEGSDAPSAAEDAAAQGAGDALARALARLDRPEDITALAQSLALLGQSAAAEDYAASALSGAPDPAPLAAIRAEFAAEEPAALWARTGLPALAPVRLEEARFAAEVASGEVNPALWLEDVAQVITLLEPLADLVLAGADLRLGTTVLQGQEGEAPGTRPTWIAGKVDPESVTGTVESLLLWQAKREPEAPQVGLMIADWSEALASSQVDLGLAVKTRIPPGRAPNALLLAAPEQDGWSPGMLSELLGDLRAAIAARTVDLTSLPGSARPRRGEALGDNAGLFLPVLWLPPAPVDDPEF